MENRNTVILIDGQYADILEVREPTAAVLLYGWTAVEIFAGDACYSLLYILLQNSLRRA